MKILAVDVGLVHLALVSVEVPDNYLTRDEVLLCSELTTCNLIDIIELMAKCRDSNCELYHDKIICDYVTHLFKKYKDLFESADKILIERQPITGIVAVQELIMKEYRHKSELISPNAMLNFFDILQYEYKVRKVHTVKFASTYLGSFEEFVFNERKHDMADALCLIYYHLSDLRKTHRVEQDRKMKEEQDKLKYGRVCLNIESYAYTGE